jgi:hypothetical protein
MTTHNLNIDDKHIFELRGKSKTAMIVSTDVNYQVGDSIEFKKLDGSNISLFNKWQITNVPKKDPYTSPKRIVINIKKVEV